MPALPQLDHCPAQRKATPPCASLCAFSLQQTLSGTTNHVSGMGHCHLVVNAADFKVQSQCCCLSGAVGHGDPGTAQGR